MSVGDRVGISRRVIIDTVRELGSGNKAAAALRVSRATVHAIMRETDPPKGEKPRKVDKRVELLERHDIGAKQLKELLDPSKRKRPPFKQAKTKSVFTFGIVSDTHLCDSECALPELQHFYQVCADEGITDVVHAGDLVTGMSVYPGQLHDLAVFGYDKQLEFAVENYPSTYGITTHVIGGNHEEDYTKRAGFDMLNAIAKERDDILYHGMYDATIKLNGVSIGLQHGARGVGYAASYPLQRYIERIPPGEKPQIFILGHYHCSLYMFERDIHAFLPGSFMWSSNLLAKRLKLSGRPGGFIVTVTVADDKHNTITDLQFRRLTYYKRGTV